MSGARFGAGTPFERDQLFGGVGRVRVWDLLGATAAPPFTAVLGCELDAGGSVGRHRQEEFAEVVLGVEGDGEAEVDGVIRPLGPGDVVHLPLGAVLAIRNRSADEALRYLIVKATGGVAGAPPPARG